MLPLPSNTCFIKEPIKNLKPFEIKECKTACKPCSDFLPASWFLRVKTSPTVSDNHFCRNVCKLTGLNNSYPRTTPAHCDKNHGAMLCTLKYSVAVAVQWKKFNEYLPLYHVITCSNVSSNCPNCKPMTFITFLQIRGNTYLNSTNKNRIWL